MCITWLSVDSTMPETEMMADHCPVPHCIAHPAHTKSSVWAHSKSQWLNSLIAIQVHTCIHKHRSAHTNHESCPILHSRRMLSHSHYTYHLERHPNNRDTHQHRCGMRRQSLCNPSIGKTPKPKRTGGTAHHTWDVTTGSIWGASCKGDMCTQWWHYCYRVTCHP